MDLEVVEGGWVVACWGSDTVLFVGSGCDAAVHGAPADTFLAAGGALNRAPGRGGGGLDRPCALVCVPGLGLVVRDLYNGGRLQVFATRDAVAMAAMSPSRVAWMVAVARGFHHRR
jgi:hypothetical protein